MSETSPGTADRRRAALAHALWFVPIAGVFVTLAIYLRARERSPFVEQHARGALRFQALSQGPLFTLALILAAGLLRAAMALGLPGPASLAAAAVPLAAWVLYGLVAVAAALARALAGRPCRYPGLGGP